MIEEEQIRLILKEEEIASKKTDDLEVMSSGSQSVLTQSSLLEELVKQ